VTLQERTASDSVSLYSPSNSSAYSYSLTGKPLPGPKKEDSNRCLHKLVSFRLESVRCGSEQGQRQQPDSQKSLVDLIADSEGKSFVSYPMEKNAPVTSTNESTIEGQKRDRNNRIKAVPLESLSLARIIQHETGISYAHNIPGELQFNPSVQAQRNCSSNELSLSDLANLSSQASSSSKPAHIKENNATLSGVSSHYEIESRIPNFSHMGNHVIALHLTRCTSVEGISSASPAVSALKSDVAINHECKGLSVKGKSYVFALMVSHPIEDNVPHYLSRVRQCIHKKLTQYYMSRNFKTFNFSTTSPDDLIQEKQHNVFQ
jgi:hypothetical protein